MRLLLKKMLDIVLRHWRAEVIMKKKKKIAGG